MSKLICVALGVDDYDDVSLRTSGPCSSAIKFTEWVLSLQYTDKSIHLFISSSDETIKEKLNGLKTMGVHIHDAKMTEVDDFIRKELLWRRDNENATLVFYCSGHGCEAGANHRVLLLADFTAAKNNAIVDVTRLEQQLLRLKSGRLQDQFIFCDMCAASKRNIDLVNSSVDGTVDTLITQSSYYATPLGKKARAHITGTEFTNNLLSSIGSLTSLNHEDIFQIFRHHLKSRRLPFDIALKSGKGDSDVIYGPRFLENLWSRRTLLAKGLCTLLAFLLSIAMVLIITIELNRIGTYEHLVDFVSFKVRANSGWFCTCFLAIGLLDIFLNSKKSRFAFITLIFPVVFLGIALNTAFSQQPSIKEERHPAASASPSALRDGFQSSIGGMREVSLKSDETLRLRESHEELRILVALWPTAMQLTTKNKNLSDCRASGKHLRQLLESIDRNRLITPALKVHYEALLCYGNSLIASLPLGERKECVVLAKCAMENGQSALVAAYKLVSIEEQQFLGQSPALEWLKDQDTITRLKIHLVLAQAVLYDKESGHFEEFYSSVLAVSPDYWKDFPPRLLPSPYSGYVTSVLASERSTAWVAIFFLIQTCLLVAHILLNSRPKDARISSSAM